MARRLDPRLRKLHRQVDPLGDQLAEADVVLDLSPDHPHLSLPDESRRSFPAPRVAQLVVRPVLFRRIPLAGAAGVSAHVHLLRQRPRPKLAQRRHLRLHLLDGVLQPINFLVHFLDFSIFVVIFKADSIYIVSAYPHPHNPQPPTPMATFARPIALWRALEPTAPPPGLSDLRRFLSILTEFDAGLIQALEAERDHGRDDYPVAAMWNLHAVTLYLRRARFSDVLAELQRNRDLARLLGFREIGPGRYLLPGKQAFSRFHVKLKQDRFQILIGALLTRAVEGIRGLAPSVGTHSALDSTNVRTHARPPRKSSKDPQADPKKPPPAPKPSADPQASWSVKTKVRQGENGQTFDEKECTFGYKAFVVCDTRLPVVLAAEVVTGKDSDQRMAIPMIEKAQTNVGNGVFETVAMDKGFDSEDNVRGAHERGVAAIVPVRDVPENLDRLPPEDREVALAAGSNLVRDRFTGEVFCYARSRATGPEPVRRAMTYAGYEADRQGHKFRCPLGDAAASKCPVFRTCAAGSCGNNGRQVRIPVQTDWRRFAPVYPRSKRWKRLYNGRSAVERVNSYFKEVLRLEDHCLRGKAAIRLRVLMASLTLNIRTLMQLQTATPPQR